MENLAECNENIQLVNIVELYQENGTNPNLIKLLHYYSASVISENKQDPFWTDTAKNILEIIVLTNLVAKNSCTKSELETQIKDTNAIKTMVKENLEKLSIPELKCIMSSKAIIDSEKPFESVMDIIRKALLPQNSVVENKKEENLKEYSLEVPNYPIFKFYFPGSMGEYIKKKDNIFELKIGNVQKIRVMISKCKSEAELEADAKKWIEKNKVEAKMEDVSYRKEKINNIPIEVYELRTIEKKDIKIYKIGYVNGCRITISGWKVNKKEEVINTAFEKITWVDNIKNNSEDKVGKKNKANEPIIIDCPACKSEFELKWNVPDTEKTFYCKCTNCGMELKRENPNYIDKNQKDKNNEMEEFLKLYSLALEKKVEKICEVLKRNNRCNGDYERLINIKADLNKSDNVETLVAMLNYRWLYDYDFELEGENKAWSKALDFRDLPVYPHYCRLKLMEYKDKSIEETLISSLNILKNNARVINNEKLVAKIEEIILNINDVDYLIRFKKMEDWLKHTNFENFENGTIKYRDFLWNIFIEVNTLIQKINDNNNPPYNNSELMDNIKRIIEVETSEEKLNFVDYDNGCILKSTKMDITIETKDAELIEYAKKLYEEYENNLMSIAKYMLSEEFSNRAEEEIIDKLGKPSVRIVNKNSADFSYEENLLEENYIISFEVTDVYEEYDYLTIDG